MPARCPAAEIDNDLCVGPLDAILVLDHDNSGIKACERHAARLLARLPKGRVVGGPRTPASTVFRVHRNARRNS